MLGDNYAGARKKAGMKREEACVKLGVSFGTIVNWETGKTKPDANNLRDMARIYKVSADVLLGLV